MKFYVRPHGPPVEVGSPHIGGPDTDPLHSPELVQEVEHQPSMQLVQMLYGKPPPQITQQIAAATQRRRHTAWR